MADPRSLPPRSPRWPLAAGAGLAALVWIGGSPLVHGETDPRIIDRYRQMLAANPVEGTALDRLWTIAEKEGFTTRLVKEARTAARKAKGAFAEEMVLGLFLSRSGKNEEAANAFRAAAKAGPESPLPHLALARLLPPEQQAPELEEAARRLSPDSPERPETLRRLGEAYLAAGTPEKAAAAWEEWVADAPSQPELRQKLARLYAENGMPEQALAHYAVLEKEGDPPMRVEALRGMAVLQAKAGRPAEALDTLSRALGLVAPGHWLRPEISAEMIRIAREGDALPTLEARWKGEADARPRDAAPWLQLADLAAARNDPAAERAALEQAVERAPNETTLRVRLARLLVRQEALEEARTVYNGLPNGPETLDLALERATLEVRLGDLQAAEDRLREAVKAAPDDVAFRSRVGAFFEKHRMHAALEAWLRSPEGNDPVALATFLFSQRRTEEARQTLRAMIRPDATPEERTAAHQKAAEVYRQVGNLYAAAEEYRAAAVTTPESAEAWMALGDFLLTLPGGASEAAKAFSRAYGASRGSQKEEADQRFFRALEMESRTAGAVETSGEEKSTEAQRVTESLLSAPIRDLFPFRPADQPTARGVSRQIVRLQQEAELHPKPGTWLRLARWLYWNRELEAARDAAAEAVKLQPDLTTAREMQMTIALAAGDREAALEALHTLAEIDPKQEDQWLKQEAQIRFQMGQPDEALAILEKRAASGEPSALMDLAQGQQQADRWYDALATWETLYKQGDGARRAACITPMVRAMQRLEMNRRVAEFLWEVIEQTPDESLRDPYLNDLIQHCRNKGMTRWLLEQLEARVAETGAAADRRALAQALKATGEPARAFRELLKASETARDIPAAEEELVRQAEEMRDLDAAAEHQQRRIQALPLADVAEWEKLARLQEAALRYREAGATRLEMVRRFPRDVPALLRHARFFNQWGEPAQALEILRQARKVDATHAEAAAALLRQPGAMEAERVAAARAVLAAPAPQGVQSLRLPPEPEPLGNRVRACFALFGSGRSSSPVPAEVGEVTLWDENLPATTEAEWRLEAIRFLSGRITGLARPAWVARWLVAGGPPSETLWALSGANASREAFTFLEKKAEATPGDRPMAGALVWTGLRLGLGEPLGQWLWKPERTDEEREVFRTLLGEWAGAGRPLDLTLFDGASPAQAWSYAETLASRRRYPEAARLGRRLYDAMPGPRAAIGYPLSLWLIKAGDTPAAVEILRTVASEPAGELTAPPYAAQQLLYTLLPEGERGVWSARMLDGLKNRPAPAGGSPLHTVLTTGLLHSLAGRDQEAASEWERLARLRAASVEDGVPAVDRSWQFLLATGIQLQRWNLRPAAEALWKEAVADRAAIRLQGERATAYAEEIRARLLANQLVEAGSRQPIRPLLEAAFHRGEPASLNTVAMVLDAEGFKALHAEVLDFVQQSEPGTPILRTLSACKTANDPRRARAAVDRWLVAPEQDTVSTPAALDFLAARDPALARETAEKLAEAAPGDQRVLERLARYQLEAGAWAEAAALYRRLIPLQPGNAHFRLNLLNALAGPGDAAAAEAALEELKAEGTSLPALEARRVGLLLQAGRGEEARTAAAGVLRSAAPPLILEAATALYNGGRPDDGLALLAAAVEEAVAAGKPRAAFTLQLEGVRLMEKAGDEDRLRRWRYRLQNLAGTYPDLLSQYYEWLQTHASTAERHRELEAAWDGGNGPFISGAWTFSSLLDTAPDAAPALLDTLLQRPDVLPPLLLWLEKRCADLGRYDLCDTLTGWLLERMPDETDLRLRRVRTLQALGQKKAAAALLEQIRPEAAIQPELNGDLALAAQELGRPDLARPFFVAAVAADPAALRYRVHLGYARLFLEEGNVPAARRALRRAYRNPANRETAPVVEYLRRSGKPVAEAGRDLALPAPLTAEVERLMAGSG